MNEAPGPESMTAHPLTDHGEGRLSTLAAGGV